MVPPPIPNPGVNVKVPFRGKQIWKNTFSLFFVIFKCFRFLEFFFMFLVDLWRSCGDLVGICWS